MKKVALFMEYEEFTKNEEISWVSRTQWLKEGDKNIKFLHKIANGHKRDNSIDQLIIQEVITEDTAKI